MCSAAEERWKPGITEGKHSRGALQMLEQSGKWNRPGERRKEKKKGCQICRTYLAIPQPLTILVLFIFNWKDCFKKTNLNFLEEVIVFCGRKSIVHKKKADSYFHIKWLSSYGTSKHTAALVLRVTVGQLLMSAKKFIEPHSKLGNSPWFLSLERNLRAAEDTSQNWQNFCLTRPDSSTSSNH